MIDLYANSQINILSVSGGKDSTAMYLHALELGVPFQAVFADTGNEHEITLDYIRQLPARTGGPEIEWVSADFSEDFARKRRYIIKYWPAEGVPQEKVEQAASEMASTGSLFLDCCKMHGLFPGGVKMKFCTSDLKIEPISNYHDRYLEDGKTVVSWVGIRAEESIKRAKLPEIETEPGCNRIVYRPLLSWTLADVGQHPCPAWPGNEPSLPDGLFSRRLHALHQCVEGRNSPDRQTVS
ncbi:MAG: phosphoadenosine phosphosulfate reductase family protein [Magnetococcales bacterium]|nr:phosphoadenosine phosphosulfate reductase family protein [Magnetococcales bacterium]